MSMINANSVVARYRDGRTVKGVTRDFAPGKPTFHVFEDGDEKRTAIQVGVAELKAVFFVKSYEGDPTRQDEYDFDTVRQQGRRVVVTFEDGEQVAGYTMGYSEAKPGFFVIPADAGSNNARIYVVAQATGSIEFLSPGDSWAASA